MSLSHNKEVSEDIVSNAFYKALQSADDTISNFKAWLLTVCRNEYVDFLRKESRISSDEISEELEDERESVVNRVIQNEDYKALYKAIDLLPKAQREVIILFYFSNLSVREISQITNKSEANVKVIMHRAREFLRTLLEDTK